jgi:hypothetical protein
MDSLEIQILGLFSAKANGSQALIVLGGITVLVLAYRLTVFVLNRPSRRKFK